MTVVNTRSAYVTNTQATPPVISQGHLHRGRALSSVGLVASANGDSSTSTYRHTRIKSSDRVIAVNISCDALGGSAAADVGLYDTEDNGGAVVDADFFASAVSLVSALARTDITHEAGGSGYTISKREKRVWEALGLSADPMKEYDVVSTLTAASAAAGNVVVDVSVTSGP